MRVHPDVQAVLQAIKANPPDPPTDSLFHTQNANFGAYLVAANRLRYCGARLAPNHTDVDLLFNDPQCLGADLLRRFNAGVVEQVNARVLFETRGYLLSEVKRTLTAGWAMPQDNVIEFLSRKQAAELLSCSDQLVSKLIKNKKLRAYKLGRIVRIKRTDLLSVLKECQ